MLILRIRQAESALTDGRLDEAFELARQEDVRAHRRGQRLIGRLVRALAGRGRVHLAAGRLPQALADCEKAERLGGNLPEVTGLRAQATEAMLARQHRDHQRADAVAAARQHVERGRLSAGEAALADFEVDSTRAKGLQREVAARRAAVESALTRAENALQREDWGTAIDALMDAKRTHPANDRLNELTGRVTGSVTQRIRAALDQGRVDLAESLLQRLAPLAGSTIEARELARIMAQCRLAFEYVQRGQPRQTVEVLHRLASILPGAAWVSLALTSAQHAADALEQLRGGPLGLLMSSRPDARDDRITQVDPEAETLPPAAVGLGGGPGPTPVPAKFMMRVDGVGSYLVLRNRRVTIGPVSASRPADVGLLAEPGLPVVTIERTDEDYFLSSDRPVTVNGRPVTERLLTHGDRIALSPRCRLRFELPNATSPSAVLQLSGTRLPKGDARRVILLDRAMIVGPGPSAHVRADQLNEPAVLHVRDGRLFCRGKAPVIVNDRPMDRLAGIPMNANVRMGPVSLVLTTA